MKCRTGRDGRWFPFDAKEELRADQQPFERALDAAVESAGFISVLRVPFRRRAADP